MAVTFTPAAPSPDSFSGNQAADTIEGTGTAVDGSIIPRVSVINGDNGERVSTANPLPTTAATLPLPANAAKETGGNLAALVIEAENILAALQGTLGAIVSVSNFPATQPVSAASLPLPAGAATEGGNLLAIKNAVQGTLGVTGTVTVVDSVPLSVSASSLPLPAGAATAAKQPALGTAGAPSADVLSVQGEASMTPLKVDGSATTQPVSGTVTANAGTGTMAVSAAALPLPSGASTAAKQPALGTAGTPSADVLTVQGATSMTALQTALPDVTGSATLSAAQPSANTPVTNATLALTLKSGQSTWKGQVNATGFGAGTTLVTEYSQDNGTTWQATTVAYSGGLLGSSFTGGAVLQFRGNCAGFTNVRVRCTVLGGGDGPVVNLDATTAAGTEVKQGASYAMSGTLQAAVSASGNGSTMNTQGMATVTFVLTGTFVASVALQGSSDSTRWDALDVTQLGVGPVAGGIVSAVGTYRASCAALQLVRAVVTWVSGTSVTVTAEAVPVSDTVRSVLATVQASENHIGSVGGAVLPTTASYTRPLDTTAYTANDAIANSTSAPVALSFTSAARVAAGSGLIVSAVLVDEANQTTPAQFNLYLFNASPTATNDNAQLAISNADLTGKLIGVIYFSTSVVSGTGSGSSGSRTYNSGTVSLPFLLPSGTTIFGILQAANAYTPVSGEVFSITLQILPN